MLPLDAQYDIWNKFVAGIKHLIKKRILRTSNALLITFRLDIFLNMSVRFFCICFKNVIMHV